MTKRIAALILSLLLIVAVLPVGVSAEEDEAAQIKRNIQRHYAWTRSATGKWSLGGYCGVLAGYQLSYLGVTKWPVLANGNDYYDLYENMEYTETGYRVKTYPAENYTLEEALNAASRNGTRDVYNILVGFHSTNTEAGSRYGHVVVIYAIVDGVVYYTESFGGGRCLYEGYAVSCTIEEFVESYDSWTRFEGVVVFGQKEYTDNCTEYSTHMYGKLLQDAPLYTQPCEPGTEEVESTSVRIAAKGERLLITGLYENTLDQYYYQAEDGGTVFYVAADCVEALSFNSEDIVITDAVIPENLEVGKDFELAGYICGLYSTVGAVRMNVTDQSSEVVVSHDLMKKSGSYDLKKDTFNKAVDFGVLEEGLYTYNLYADGLYYYLQDGMLRQTHKTVTLCSVPFTVGEEQDMPVQAAYMARIAKDGWLVEEGVWYYYEQGAPRAGWFCWDGVDYYLQEDGAVTTGWAKINGKWRYFSDTGAMRTGWLTTEEGTMYLLSNGQTAYGWQIVDEKKYYFDENGLMQRESWITEEEHVYYLLADGSAATGWVTLEEGTFCFHEDGRLLAQSVEENGQLVLRAYGPNAGVIGDIPAAVLKDISIRK